MQCSSQHIFSAGDRISFKKREIPDKYQEAQRTHGGRPFPVTELKYLPDGRSASQIYVITEAKMCNPDEIPNRQAFLETKWHTGRCRSAIPFKYQRLLVVPEGVVIEHPALSTIRPDTAALKHGSDMPKIGDGDRGLNHDKPSGEIYTHIAWFLDVTTMAIREDKSGTGLFTIDKLFLYDRERDPIIIFNKKVGKIECHCPCVKCNPSAKYGQSRRVEDLDRSSIQ